MINIIEKYEEDERKVKQVYSKVVKNFPDIDEKEIDVKLGIRISNLEKILG